MLSNIFEKVYLQEVKKQEPEFDLVRFLAEKLLSTEQVDVPGVDTKYRASGIAKVCERQEVLMSILKVGLTRKIDPSLQMTFDIGHGFHYIVQNKWLKDLLIGNWRCVACGKYHNWSRVPKKCMACSADTGFEYMELSFDGKDGYLITGHPDGVLEYPNGKKVLLELKTTNSAYFKYILDSGKPLSDHMDQIMIYMWFLDVKEAAVVYFSKDDSKLRIFNIDFDQERLNKLLKKIDVIKGGIRTNLVPTRYVCDSISCARAKRCPVKNKCFELPIYEGVYNGNV